MSKELNFDEWYCLHEDEINIELAENGADREMDFDPELEFEIRYEDYLNQNKIKKYLNIIQDVGDEEVVGWKYID